MGITSTSGSKPIILKVSIKREDIEQVIKSNADKDMIKDYANIVKSKNEELSKLSDDASIVAGGMKYATYETTENWIVNGSGALALALVPLNAPVIQTVINMVSTHSDTVAGYAAESADVRLYDSDR